MKNSIVIIRLYTFRKINQQAIYLHLYQGVIPDVLNGKSIRWMIKGRKNPFPVRNGTWFQGFDGSTMIQYLAQNGYELTNIIPFGEINLSPMEYIP